MTHGHFDHVGALEDLARDWDVPVYAHVLEHPYLDGRASYPPGDPSVGGGMMATLAPLYPRGPVDLRDRLRRLPEDGSVPALPGWRWIHTPGHSAGHVSFWRASDRSLIVGDAFITTRQESAYAVALQSAEMHGPPMYYTTEWDKAKESVARLSQLAPELVITGHGRPMQGPEMRQALGELAHNFDRVAVPARGIYLSQPARAEDGNAYRRYSARPAREVSVKAALWLGASAFTAAWLLSRSASRRAKVSRPRDKGGPTSNQKQFAVVTGASTGIGFELARCCIANGYDVLIVANEPEIRLAAQRLRNDNAEIRALEADLSTTHGVDQLCAEIHHWQRPVDALLANAGAGEGKGFLDQDIKRIRFVIDTNITGTVYLVHRIGQMMRRRGTGRILITGSIAGFMPGPFQAIYNASKAFLDSFSWAIRNELKDTGVTVTCLMPGPTDTEFFRRAGLLDTELGQSNKDDPATVAQRGFEAMMRGEGDIVPGTKNKLQAAMSHVTPSATLAEMHRHLAQPKCDIR